MKDATVKFGKYIKTKRVKANLTQSRVAKELGYSSAQFISNIERGCCLPPPKMLREMVGMYKIPQREILKFLVDMDTQRWKRVLAGRI